MLCKDINKTALIHNNKEISFGDLQNIINRFSELFTLNKGDRAAIFSENRPEWIYSFYAVWKKEAVNVPIDFLSTAEEVCYILNDCRPEVIFTSNNNYPVLSEALKQVNYPPKVILYEDISYDGESKYKNGFSIQDKDSTAVIIYTSGTTGSPKGVMLSFNNLVSNINCITTEWSIISYNDRTLAILPFHHAFPLQGTILMPLFIGATVVLLNQVSSDEIIRMLQKYKITYLIGVPRLYNLFHSGIMSKINANKIAILLYKLSRAVNSYSFGKKLFKKVQNTFGGNIQYLVSGGAKLDPEVAKDFKAMGFKILEGYGMTEASPLISFNPPEKVKIGSVGKPYQDVNIKIIDEEIVLSGKNITAGYYNKEDETKEIIKDGWLHTGDLGYIDNDGYIFITGRRKETIILPNGKNLNPEEIEDKILKNNKIIKEIGVTQKDDQLCAVILPDFKVVQEMNVINIQETIKWDVIDKYNLSASPYKKITNFTIVHNELPKTRLGKIKRFTISELLKKEKKTEVNVDIPDYQEYKLLEEYLKSIVKKDILPDEHVELDLGLDSLAKVELQVQIEKTFGITMSNEDLTVYSTVRKLADYIREKKTKIENEVIHWGKVFKEEIHFEIPHSTFMLKFLKAVTKPLFKLYFRVKVEGLENLKTTPVIIAPNHQSFIDGLLIANSLDNRTLNKTYFFAKEKNIKTWISRFFARNSNILVLNINKDLKLTLQKIASVIKHGNNMVIFPEGARSRDGNVMSFKKSFAIISKELDVPIVPLVIQGAYEKFSIGSRFPKPGTIKLKFLKPVYPASLNYDSITELTRESILSNASLS